MKRRRSKWDKRPVRKVESGPTPEFINKPVVCFDPVVQMVRRGKLDPPQWPYLTADQEWCVERFRRLYTSFIGKQAHPKGALDFSYGISLDVPEGDGEAELMYLKAVEKIDLYEGRQCRDALVNVAVFRRWPIRRMNKFFLAVDVLHDGWIGRRRKVA